MEVNILILQFLIAIQGVESNHGRNLNHPEIINVNSIHFGDTAIGLFGAMPNTIKLIDRSPNSIEKYKIDKQYEIDIMLKYALYVLQRAKGCPIQASILWLKGHNYKIKTADYQTKRMTKFIKEWENITNTTIYRDPLIIKYCFN